MSKVNAFKELLGEAIVISLKQTSFMEMVPGAEGPAFGSSIKGFLIDVDEHFLYLGSRPGEGFDLMVDIEDIGIVSLIDPDAEKQIKELIEGLMDDGKDVH